MEIRDVIHGSIALESFELPIIESHYFQRLRQIKQLGFGENSFPSATHNRYIHSLGAMRTATRVFETIFLENHSIHGFQFSKHAFTRFRTVVRLAALLHDIGHGPLSHTSEIAMPNVSELHLPSQFHSTPDSPLSPDPEKSRRATHEDYTLKMILDSGLTPLLQKAGEKSGFSPIHIAALIDPDFELSDDFFHEEITLSHQHGTQKLDFRPIFSQIISSELDADRMDYLRRDSLHAGVSYGQFDFDWLVGNLTCHFESGKCFLCLQHRALYTFEDFLLSRFHMFLMIYFHYKSVIFDEMLKQYFSSPDCNYFIPADIEEYCQFNDTHLYTHLAASKNPWAKRISDRRPYRMLIELHSGIPATKTARLDQQRLLAQIEYDLKSSGIHFLVVTSTSEFSKYFRRPGDPIFVRYDNHFNPSSFIPLEQCTDLFQKYSEKRSITRLYVSPEDYDFCKQLGKTTQSH